MLFTLKKVIGGMLLPLPFLLLMMGIGLALLWFSRFQKTGKVFISLSWLVLFLLSLQPVADHLLRPIENSYPTWQDTQKVEYVVVLGGGYTWNPQWTPSSNLINNSLPRLNEGLRLWRANPGSKLIFASVPGACSATIAAIFAFTRSICSGESARRSPRATATGAMMLVLPFTVARMPPASRSACCPPAIKPTLKVRFGSGSSVRKRLRMRVIS